MFTVCVYLYPFSQRLIAALIGSLGTKCSFKKSRISSWSWASVLVILYVDILYYRVSHNLLSNNHSHRRTLSQPDTFNKTTKIVSSGIILPFHHLIFFCAA